MRETRTALELQLTDNVLALAREYKARPEKASEFFNQSLLEDPNRNNEEAPPPPAGP